MVECRLCSIRYILLMLLVLDHDLSKVCAKLILVVYNCCRYRFACLYHIIGSSRSNDSILAKTSESFPLILLRCLNTWSLCRSVPNIIVGEI